MSQSPVASPANPAAAVPSSPAAQAASSAPAWAQCGEPPRICIVGPGAIGGWIGATLSLAGVARVSTLARGETLKALNQHGWRLRQAGELHNSPATASADAAELGVQDVIFVTVKGPALAQVAKAMGPLIGPDTLIVLGMNGVPWWFCDGLAPTLREATTQALQATLDPGGALARLLPQGQVLGCAVHVSASTPEPGLVAHAAGSRLVLGEPTGAPQARTQALAELLRRAGMEITLSDNVRQLIWTKLLSNLTMNPISALTASNTAQILDDGPCYELCMTVMQEALALGARLNCAEPNLQPKERLRLSRQAGPIRTSMLQDLDAGRPLELEGIVGTVVHLAKVLKQPCPSLDALYALCGLLGQQRGLYTRPTPSPSTMGAPTGQEAAPASA